MSISTEPDPLIYLTASVNTTEQPKVATEPTLPSNRACHALKRPNPSIELLDHPDLPTELGKPQDPSTKTAAGATTELAAIRRRHGRLIDFLKQRTAD